MSEIKYLNGDVLEARPENGKNLIITHCCNNKGGWGAGFVVAISKKWPLAEKSYRRWARNCYEGNIDDLKANPFVLGNVQLVQVEDDTFIANMIGQHDTCYYGDIPPVRYDRVRQCLNKVAVMAKEKNASVVMPRICCGLAGGHWRTVEGLIEETLIAKGIEVTVYTLSNGC